MIRDPSDGTVREIVQEALEVATKIGRHLVNEAAERIGLPAPGPDTGIRQPTRTDAQQRLERSREWIRDYHAKKEMAHAGADIEQAANGGLRAGSVGVEQQGDRREAGD